MPHKSKYVNKEERKVVKINMDGREEQSLERIKTLKLELKRARDIIMFKKKQTIDLRCRMNASKEIDEEIDAMLRMADKEVAEIDDLLADEKE